MIFFHRTHFTNLLRFRESGFIDLARPAWPFQWLSSGSARALHRFLLVRSIATAVVLSGCVPAAQYEEAQSATEVAEEGKRRVEQQLAEAEAELERLKQEHAQTVERLQEHDLEASQAAFDRSHLEKQRDEHAELVNQLRGELARVGDHLRHYSESGADLGQRLEMAQEELERLQGELDGLRNEAGDAQFEASVMGADDRKAPPREGKAAASEGERDGGEASATGAKPATSKSTDAKPADAKGAKPAEAKPADPQPSKTAPAETKPSEARSDGKR